jgi:RNA polymerase sigma-70 factor (ECF subfamily)
VPTETLPKTDPHLLERLRAGDPAIQRELLRTYMPQLFRAARAAGLSVESAEDATQNTLVTFLLKVDRFEGRSHIRTWLFGILYRKIAELRRREGRGGPVEDIDEVMESRFRADGRWARPPRETDSALYAEELRRHIADCLEGVSVAQRMAFVLREIEAMTTAEICTTLEVTPTNLGVLLYRCRNKIRECLEARGVGHA